MITVFLRGGIGNLLFQLAGLDSISTRTKRTSFIEWNAPDNHHSNQDYFETILLEWKKLSIPLKYDDFPEDTYEYREWVIPEGTIRLLGYFQNYKYVSDSFLRKLWLPNVEKLQGAFLHIRGGDYIGHHFHFVDLSDYYKRAIAMFPSDTMFYVFTDDIPYAKTLSFLQTIQCTFIEEPNEIVNLALMKNCTVGGICANSTFSWWGAYLDRNRRLVVPSKWFNDERMYIDGYFFPEAIKCPV